MEESKVYVKCFFGGKCDSCCSFLVKNRQSIAESCYLGGFCPTVTRQGRKTMRETKLGCANSFNLHKKFRPVFWF